MAVNAFEGNKAETATMLPVIRSFMTAHRLSDVTVVADAGMISAANQKAIEDAGLSFILAVRIPEVPYVIKAWREQHPGERAGPNADELDDAHTCERTGGCSHCVIVTVPLSRFK